VSQGHAGGAARKMRMGEPTAQEITWAHCLKERERGRTPTDSELDRAAGTNNDGRTRGVWHDRPHGLLSHRGSDPFGVWCGRCRSQVRWSGQRPEH
jgi:hypothetical protein